MVAISSAKFPKSQMIKQQDQYQRMFCSILIFFEVIKRLPNNEVINQNRYKKKERTNNYEIKIGSCFIFFIF